MALDPEFLDAIVLLGWVLDRHRRETGHRPALVGGAATSFLTYGIIFPDDFNFLVPFDSARSRDAGGQVPPGRPARPPDLRLVSPFIARYGFPAVSGPMFDGTASRDRLLAAAFHPAREIVMSGFAAMIANGLGQYASSGKEDRLMLGPATWLFKAGASIDRACPCGRIVQETGVHSDIGFVVP